MQSSSGLLLPQTRREDPMEKLTSERDRERGLVGGGTKKRSQKWNTQKRNRGTEIGWLEESELAPEGKYWKSIVNKDSKSATGKDAGRTGRESKKYVQLIAAGKITKQ